MSDKLDDVMTNARHGEQAFVTLVTNQDTGIATYG